MLETDRVNLHLQHVLLPSQVLSSPAQLHALDLPPPTSREYETCIGDGELPLALEVALLELRGITHLQLLIPSCQGLDVVTAGESGSFKVLAGSGEALLLEARVLRVSPRKWMDALEGVLEHARRRRELGVQLYSQNLTTAALLKFTSALKLTQYMLHHNLEETNQINRSSFVDTLEEECPSIFNLKGAACTPTVETPQHDGMLNQLSEEMKAQVKKMRLDLLLNAAQCMLKKQMWQEV
eukprot:407519-Hanusia_phi.AAC.1